MPAIDRIVTSSFRRAPVVVVLVLAGAVAGTIAFRDLRRDVFPDISVPVFNIIAQNPAMGAEELEIGIAIPVEVALAGLPDVRRIRSSSHSGVAQITIEFDTRVDYYRARQLV